MYKNLFAVDTISFSKRSTESEQISRYFLSNFQDYNDKLEKDFYLRYFLREILFEIDILEVEDFLSIHFKYTKDTLKLIAVLQLKALTSIDTIVKNARLSMDPIEYYEQVHLEYGFVKTEGVIKNQKYEFHNFYHLTAFNDLQQDLKQRKAIIESYITKIEEGDKVVETNKIKWLGKPSHLAFFISQFVEAGFIEPPKKLNGETHFKALSEEIMSAFETEEVKSTTLSKYMSSDNEKNEDLRHKYDAAGFHLPSAKEMS